MSGVPAGTLDGQGQSAFAEGTVFSKVEATLKRFYRAGAQVKLVPASTERKPVTATSDVVRTRTG